MSKLRLERRTVLSQVRVNGERKGFQVGGTVCAKAQSDGILAVQEKSQTWGWKKGSEGEMWAGVTSQVGSSDFILT